MAKKKKSTVECYIKATKGSTRCLTCSDYPEALDDILEFLDRKSRGETHLPVSSANGKPSLYEYLRDEYGYRLASTSLTKHVSHLKAGQ